MHSRRKIAAAVEDEKQQKDRRRLVKSGSGRSAVPAADQAGPLNRAHLLTLQRLAGNRVVCRTVARSAPPAVQRVRGLELDDFNRGPIPYRKPAEIPVDADGIEALHAESNGHYFENLEKGGDLLKTIDAWNAAGVDSPANADQFASPADDYETYFSTQPTDERVNISSRSRNAAAGQAEYQNQYERGGTFIAEQNFRNRDNNANEETRERPAPPNSEMIWHQYQVAAEHYGLELEGNLRQLKRSNIINYSTADTIFWSDGGGAAQDTEVRPEDDDFAALLGSPNGRSAAFLLTQHGAEMGAEGIESIVYNGETRNMTINFRLKDPAAVANDLGEN